MISFTASHITFFFYILALIESVSLLCTVNEANKSILGKYTDTNSLS